LRDDGVDIDLPSRELIEGALEYLKNNKAAGADSIAAELLKNGTPNLVDALDADDIDIFGRSQSAVRDAY
jgi:hypothetical protein